MNPDFVLSDRTDSPPEMLWLLNTHGELYKKTNDGWWRILPEDTRFVFDRESQGTGL